MRLVIKYQDTDGCTFWCTNTFPVEYESAERLLVDIEHNVLEWKISEYDSEKSTMMIGTLELYLGHFLEDDDFVPPSIYTVDEWFKANDQ